MAASTTFTYKTDASAGDIPAIVHYKPADTTEIRRPVAIILHAGGYVGGGTFMIPRAQIDTLLDLGFVVVTPEYRLCPQVSILEGPLADARDAFSWIRAELPALLRTTANINIDESRIAAMGHSAGGNLALMLGGEAKPPTAVLSLYPGLYFDREFHHKPLAAFAAMPDTSKEHRDRIFQGPVPYSAPPMITREGKPEGSPRSAWMIQAIKEGTLLADVVKDGNYGAVDSTRQFKKGFPPTAMIHGTKDPFAPYDFAVDAVESLKALEVTTEMITVPEQGHMFDMPIARDHELFQYIQQGLNFLARNV